RMKSELFRCLNFIFQCGDPFRADYVNHAAEFLNLLTQPRKFFLADAVMLRVARFDIGFFELLEPRTISTKFARPAVNQAHIKTLRLRSQKAEIVNVWCVECANQKNGMVHSFGGLM